MISPEQITYDISSLPAAVQTFVTTLDGLLQTWQFDESCKSFLWTWGQSPLGAFTEAKRTGLNKLMDFYRKLGWDVQTFPRVNDIAVPTQFKVAFNR
jgi:hypothetical protein